jgi:WhiB family redox-sensing transcriptional regulator
MSRSLDWMDSANCRDVDPETFFPTSTGVKGQNETHRARQICRRCPVQSECAAHHKRTGASGGVWGNT